MERLISLFREVDEDQWSPGGAREPGADADRAAGADEPLYFRQLLAYLRQQRSLDGCDDGSVESAPSCQDAEAEELIGAGV